MKEWSNSGGGVLVPVNGTASDLVDVTRQGEIIAMLEVTDRDLLFHRCYFSLLNFIYSQLPKRFKAKLPEKHFYKYLKHLKGQFEIIAQFGDIVIVEYDSIAFGRMSEHTFKDYVRTQLPWIYSKVIGKYYKEGGWRFNRKIELIEDEYKRFLSKI